MDRRKFIKAVGVTASATLLSGMGIVVAPGMWPAGAVNGTEYSRKPYELGRKL